MYGDSIEVMIPPRSTAVRNGEEGSPKQRDRRLAMITERGRVARQAATGYSQGALIETTMGRYKVLIGARLRAPVSLPSRLRLRSGVAVLNQMLAAGRPKSVRFPRLIA